MSIKIRYKNRQVDPHYIFNIKYIIGDSDGHTNEETTISLKNPFIEKICRILDKLKPNKGHWGIGFSDDQLFLCHKECYISLDEFILLYLTSHIYFVGINLTKETIKENFFKRFKIQFDDYILDDIINQDNDDFDYIYEFEGLFKKEVSYSFLTYRGYDLMYVDNNGVEHNTYFENN